MLLLRCHWFIHVFFWSDNSWLFVLLLPPPSLQVTTAWCSHFSRTVSPSCPYGDLHPPVRSIPQFGGGDNSSADLVSFATFFQQGGFILLPSFSQDCNCWEYCRHLFWWSLLPSVHSRPYGLCFAYRTVLLRNFIQPVRVSFVHNYHSPLEFNTVRYFFKTLIQPVYMGFICTQLPYGPFEYTGRYNMSLSPTRGGGFSPSGSIPRPSHLVTGARTCYHSLTISKLFPRCRRYACQLSSVQK